MTLSKIGPKELYLFPAHINDANEKMKKDDQSVVTWFLEYQKNKYDFFNFNFNPFSSRSLTSLIGDRIKAKLETAECKESESLDKNILMLAALNRNYTICTFLITNLNDKVLINMEDDHGETALSHLFRGDGAPKNIECIKLFLSHGAKLNVPCIASSSKEKNEDNYRYTNTIAGHLLENWAICTNYRDSEKKNEALKTYETVFTLFLAQGALCYMNGIGKIDMHRKVEEEDTPYARQALPKILELYTNVQTNLMWPKMHLISLLLIKDRNSTLSELPADIIKNIGNVYMNML